MSRRKPSHNAVPAVFLHGPILTGYKKVNEFLLYLYYGGNALENITLLRCCRYLYYGANAQKTRHFYGPLRALFLSPPNFFL